jgi:hypothetical protein
MASFLATFGFRPPSATERAALDRVRAYLRRVESELGSRGLAVGMLDPATVDRGAATREALRTSVQAAAAFCDGLLEAAEPDAEAGECRSLRA